MKIIRWTSLTAAERQGLTRRPGRATPGDDATVRAICAEVRADGDDAVRRWTARYDHVTIDALRVPGEELRSSLDRLDPDLRSALEVAAANIRRFHEAQRIPPLEVETMRGVVCRRESRPIESVGLYVPAGSAPLPSTVLMLGIPALLAGCGRIVLCSPPRASGTIDPIVAAAAHLIGIRDVYRIGGVQAIAAMAYGTASVPRVRKIFGPGNRFVAAAKVLVSSDPEGAAIDLIAGPSEVLVLADASADPASVAWDLVSQAEHDADAHAILVTADAPLAEQVTRLLPEILATAPRAEQLRASLSHSFALIVESLDEACSFANLYAPEHLVIMTNDAARCAGQINNAGSIFIGSFSPVTAGDYASGTNHTLPTGGAARTSGGVSLQSFEKQLTLQTLTREGLEGLAPTLRRLAIAEGLDAHRRAVDVRLERAEGMRR